MYAEEAGLHCRGYLLTGVFVDLGVAFVDRLPGVCSHRTGVGGIAQLLEASLAAICFGVCCGVLPPPRMPTVPALLLMSRSTDGVLALSVKEIHDQCVCSSS